jgi:hypothetical protein
MKRPHLAALLGLTVTSIAFVAAGLPGLSAVEGWFYHPAERGLGEAWPLALGGVLVPALVWAGVVLARRGRRAWALSALTMAAFAVQMTFSLADAQGLDGPWRWQQHGHGEMARVAHARRGERIETLRRYEALVTERKLGAFAPSKPPGALGAYMAVDALAEALRVEAWLGPLVDLARERKQLASRAEAAALAFVLFPLATAFMVPLAFALGVLLFRSEGVAYAGAILAASSPAVLLIQLHLDGALYPAFALGACALAALGVRRGMPAWTALGGAVFGLSLFVTFSVLPVVGLALGCIALVILQSATKRDRLEAMHGGAWHAVAFGGGALAVLWLLALALDYQLAARLSRALDYHAHWKRAVPTGPWRGWALVEFALYVGFPLVAAFLWRVVAGARRAAAIGAAAAREPHHLAPLALLPFLFALSLAAGTNEVARLWLFLVPFVALAAATGTSEAARAGQWWTPACWLAACQAVLALVLKANQVW